MRIRVGLSLGAMLAVLVAAACSDATDPTATHVIPAGGVVSFSKVLGGAGGGGGGGAGISGGGQVGGGVNGISATFLFLQGKQFILRCPATAPGGCLWQSTNPAAVAYAPFGLNYVTGQPLGPPPWL